MKKKLHYLDLAQQIQRKHAAISSLNIPSLLLAKYFPKYQKGFILIKKNGAITSKIKRAKLIENFHTLPTFQKRSSWRILLANKMKTLKTLINSAESPKQFAEKLKDLPGLRCARIEMLSAGGGPFASQNKQRDFLLKKACKNIGCALHLEHLKISCVSTQYKNYVRRLNAHKRVLGSLKTLKFYFDWTGANNAEISELVEGNKNLLRNVTSLRLSPLHSNFHFERFQRLGELCPKVLALSFEFSCRELAKNKLFSKSSYTECFEVKTNYLQTLKAFQHLQYLSLGIGDILTFLKDFVLPLSIQSLRLEFQEVLSKEVMLKIDNDFAGSSEEDMAKVFSENSLLVRFYDSFIGLDYLESLQLIFALGPEQETYSYFTYLFKFLLKRVASPLKSLLILPSLFSGRFTQAPNISEIQDSFLPQFIESCGNFATKLRTLDFGSQKVIYSNFDLSAYCNKFPNLCSLEVRANFCQSQEGSNVEKVGSFLEHLICLGESITFIKLKADVNGDTKSLISILKQMNKLKKTDKLKIKLELNLIKTEEAGIDFIDVAEDNEELYPKLKKVSLNINNDYSITLQFKKFLKIYQERFDKF